MPAQNLSHSDRQNHRFVYSPEKNGVGKSSVCINLGIVLAQLGYRVCLIDVDLGLKNLDVMLGLENRVIYDLRDVMEGIPLSMPAGVSNSI